MIRAPALFAMLWLLSPPSFGQRVVVLDLPGDRGGRLHAEIELSLVKAGTVTVVSTRAFRLALRIAGSAPAASKRLSLDALVSGKVARSTFEARILGPAGDELWSRKIPLRRGLLSRTDARRFASAVAAAATAKREPPVSVPPVETPPPEPTPPLEPPPPSPRIGVPMPPPPVPEPAKNIASFAVELGLEVTWRSYCARPGVRSCAEYDALAEANRPPGQTVQFSGWIPYAGAAALVEVRPFSLGAGRGLWAGASYSLSESAATVYESSPSSTTPTKLVHSLDQRATLAFAFDFALGSSARLGPVVGGELHFFDVDSIAGVSLNSSRRIFPWAGARGTWPFGKRFKLDGAAAFLAFPTPGSAERDAFGSPARSWGISAELGVHGPLWSTFDCVVRARAELYEDRFLGSGARWSLTKGGAAQELYGSLVIGLRWAFVPG